MRRWRSGRTGPWLALIGLVGGAVVVLLTVDLLAGRGGDGRPSDGDTAATSWSDVPATMVHDPSVPSVPSLPSAPSVDPSAGADDAPDDVRHGWDPSHIRGHAPGRDLQPLPTPLASVAGTELLAPAKDTVAIGFHEASTSLALPMQPLGPLVANHNTTRHTPAGTARQDAHEHIVMASRGRAAGPTSAVDVVVRPDEPILAPLTGTVTDVRAYAMYGEYADHRVEIRSQRDPRVRAVLVHVSGVRVEPGETVVAGRSVVAGSATSFPFASQIDRETEPHRFPHVHLEVQPFDARRPGDPPPDVQARGDDGRAESVRGQATADDADRP